MNRTPEQLKEYRSRPEVKARILQNEKDRRESYRRSREESGTTVKEKTCRHCHETKLHKDFRKNSGTKDGLQLYCKVCQKVYDDNYESSDHGQRKLKDWRKSNYIKNKEKYRASTRRCYVKFRANRIQRSKDWIANNHDRWLDRVREYSRRPYVRAKLYDRQHRSRANTKGQENFTSAQWERQIALQDGCCNWCGARTKLCKDHIIPVNRGGWNSIDNIQGLCVRCNGIKQDKMPWEDILFPMVFSKLGQVVVAKPYRRTS